MRSNMQHVFNRDAERIAKELVKIHEELARDGYVPTIEEVVAHIRKETPRGSRPQN